MNSRWFCRPMLGLVARTMVAACLVLGLNSMSAAQNKGSSGKSPPSNNNSGSKPNVNPPRFNPPSNNTSGNNSGGKTNVFQPKIISGSNTGGSSNTGGLSNNGGKNTGSGGLGNRPVVVKTPNKIVIPKINGAPILTGNNTGNNSGKINLGKGDKINLGKPDKIVVGKPDKINVGKPDKIVVGNNDQKGPGNKAGFWDKTPMGWVWKNPQHKPNFPGPNANNKINITNISIVIPLRTLGNFRNFLPPPYFGDGANFVDGGVVDGGGPPVIVDSSVPPAGDDSSVLANAQQITEVYEGPAQKAGLRGGDIILALNNRRIRNYDDLAAVVKSTSKECVIVIFSTAKNQVEQLPVRLDEGRFGTSVVDVQVDIDEDQSPPPPVVASNVDPGTTANKPAGNNTPANNQPAANNNTTANNKPAGNDGKQPAASTGVTALRITEVMKGPSARAGLQVGDILLGVNGQPVRNQAEVDEILRGNPAEVEIVFYSPDEQKTETRRFAVPNGSLGLSFELVTVATGQ